MLKILPVVADDTDIVMFSCGRCKSSFRWVYGHCVYVSPANTINQSSSICRGRGII